MELIHWIIDNFGLFFGALFLFYLYLIVRRLTVLYDLLRHIPAGEKSTPMVVGEIAALNFLNPLFNKLSFAKSSAHIDALIDALWAEIDCQIGVHFKALTGYVNTLVLLGFAGTIFGSIGAFNEMFHGLAQGESVVTVFAASWSNGLATALYTSLGAAVIGGMLGTILCSRVLLTRSRRLDTLVAIRISELLDDTEAGGDGNYVTT